MLVIIIVLSCLWLACGGLMTDDALPPDVQRVCKVGSVTGTGVAPLYLGAPYPNQVVLELVESWRTCGTFSGLLNFEFHVPNE